MFGTQLFIKPEEYQSQLTYPVIKNTNTEKHGHTERSHQERSQEGHDRDGRVNVART